MTKFIAVTMRVEVLADRKECRDAIDQQWFHFIKQCGFVPLLLPNDLHAAFVLIDQIKPVGFIFTGGNSLTKYGGKATSRDQLEQALLKHAVDKSLPVLGVCRGMQVIQDYWQIPLKKVSGHVCKQQQIEYLGKIISVNSYHHFGTELNHDAFDVLARAQDGIVKSISHQTLPIKGIMWHPERLLPFRGEDISLIKEHFK